MNKVAIQCLLVALAVIPLATEAGDSVPLSSLMKNKNTVFIGPWLESPRVCVSFEITDQSDSVDFKEIAIGKIARIIEEEDDCDEVVREKFFYVTDYMPPRLIIMAYEIIRKIEHMNNKNSEYLKNLLVEGSPLPTGDFSLISVVGGDEVSDQKNTLELHFTSKDAPEMTFMVGILVRGADFEVRTADSALVN